MKRKLVILSFLIFAAGIGYAQVKCFARVQLDRNSVYVQQPFRITITVLTATWYTAPLDFENIQIPNAFILPFDQTSPGMYTVGGKQYAGLQFYFIVFPYNAGSFTVPSIDITATTPPEGSATSQKLTIHTNPVHFTVKPIPENTTKQEWMVAKSVAVSEKWSKPLTGLKVGDVVERTVTIDARGTLPQFIPALPEQSLDFASIYPQSPSLRDERDDYDANGRMEQSVIYLFEKEGDFDVPPIPVTWWNPNTSKLYSRSAPGRKIHVAVNPSLGIVATLKDSLLAKQVAATIPAGKKEVKKILGLPWYWSVFMLVAVLIVLYEIIRLGISVIREWKARRAIYLESEQYAFRRLLGAPSSFGGMLERLYAWWDRFYLPGKSVAISWQMQKQQEGMIYDELVKGMEKCYRDEDASVNTQPDFKRMIKAYRQKWRNRNGEIDDKVSDHQIPYS